MADLGGVAHGVFAVDGVVVASPDADCLDVPGFDQVGEDALGCAFRDADAFGDVAEPDVVCLGERQMRTWAWLVRKVQDFVCSGLDIRLYNRVFIVAHQESGIVANGSEPR